MQKKYNGRLSFIITVSPIFLSRESGDFIETSNLHIKLQAMIYFFYYYTYILFK